MLDFYNEIESWCEDNDVFQERPKISHEVEAWMNKHGNSTIAKITLTCNKDSELTLNQKKDEINMSFNRMINLFNRKAKRRKNKSIFDIFSIKGFARSIEFTCSYNLGFHPYLKVILFFDYDIFDSQKRLVTKTITNDWNNRFNYKKNYKKNDNLVKLNFAKSIKDGIDSADDIYKSALSLNSISELSGTKYLPRKIKSLLLDSKSKKNDFSSSFEKELPMYEVLKNSLRGCRLSAAIWYKYVNEVKGTRILEYSRRNNFRNYLEEISCNQICSNWSKLSKHSLTNQKNYRESIFEKHMPKSYKEIIV